MDAHELDLQGDVRGLFLRRELFQSWASYCVQHRIDEIPPMGNDAMRHFVSLSVSLSSCVVVAIGSSTVLDGHPTIIDCS